MNISEAYEILSDRMPGAYKIGLDVWNHRHDGPHVEWNIYCHELDYRWAAPTLCGVVILALAGVTRRAAALLQKADEAVATLSNL